MFLSIATRHQPATDLGFLLMKNPERVHETELTFGKAHVVYPMASAERCEAVLLLDVDPVELVRGRGQGEGLLDQYVNDRPYVASSFLSVALNRAYRTAMTGVSRERQELAESAIPLEIVVRPLPMRGEPDLVSRLFAPLGWQVMMEPVTGPSGNASRYVALKLIGTLRLADALSHLYVLIPVLDDDKHYWVGDDEVEKLLEKGGAWLASHPERELIARRYLKNRRRLYQAVLERLAADDEAVDADEEGAPEQPETVIEQRLNVHDLRLDRVAEVIRASGASSVADLGCGEGKLLQRLVRIPALTRILGVDVSTVSLRRAFESLKIGLGGGPKEGRVTLMQGALTYRDARWAGTDAAALVEVIEHIDPDRLPAVEAVVFGSAGFRTIVVTTPNADYNSLFEGLSAGAFRHSDHRFEWTRAEFRGWAEGVGTRNGYSVEIEGIGEPDVERGSLTQMAVFRK
jgi:3' terminal RNA ribose 2'-O-methyltransferase Hen1